MRRSIPLVLCFCLCALATGLVLAALARDVVRPSFPAHDRSAESATANVELVRRFYGAVGAVLASGDAELLDVVVAADLTEHPARPGAVPGRDGFVRALLALRATFPELTLVVDDVRAAGVDQVVARVHAEGVRSGSFLGRAAPASIGFWGPVEIWRIADEQLVERWNDPVPVALLPLGQAPVSVDALGPGGRRMTVTRLTVEPGATFPVDNGQAIRLYAVDAGTLTVEVRGRFDGRVAVARGSATPVASGPGTSIDAAEGDRVVTAPEADYTLANTGRVPVIAVAVVVSNTMDGEWPLNSSAAAASWTVAAMPKALGGALPSPAGFSARVLAANVEVDIPAQSIFSLGWVFLAPGTSLVLPAGTGTMLGAVDEGGVVLWTTGDAPVTTLGSGEWTKIPAEAESLWLGGGEFPSVILALTVDQDETTQVTST